VFFLGLLPGLRFGHKSLIQSRIVLSQYRKSHFVTLSKAKGLRQIISATSCHLDRRERSFEVGWDHKISRFARNDSCSDDFCGIAFYQCSFSLQSTR
jgi:hypothetical protein